MTRPYAVFSSHALLPSPFRGSSLSARISEVRRRFSNTLHNFCCTQFLPPMRRTGALLVGVPVPSKVGRWPSTAFGFLGTANTPCFHGPLCDQRSLRLFLRGSLLIPSKQAFPNDDARVSIGISTHEALWAKDKGCTRGVSLGWFSCIVTSNQSTTAGTLPACIPGGDTAGEDFLVPRFVFTVGVHLPT